MQKALQEKYDKDNLKDLADKVAVSLLHYSLHRRSESLKITIENVKIGKNNDIDICYPCSTKH